LRKSLRFIMVCSLSSVKLDCRALEACDLIPYPLLLKEKGDDCDAAPAGPSLSFRRGIEGEVAGRERPRSGAFP
jgi:hypothetical protein